MYVDFCLHMFCDVEAVPLVTVDSMLVNVLGMLVRVRVLKLHSVGTTRTYVDHAS